MHRLAISERHNPQGQIVELGDDPPVSNTTVTLDLSVEWIGQYGFDPRSTNLWMRNRDDSVEIGGCLHL